MSSQATPTLSIRGIGASPGVAVGRAFLLDRKKVRTPKLRLGESEVEPELKRMRTAIELSDHQLSEIKERLSQGEGHDHALILEAHRLMLHDPMFVDEVNKLIERAHINAEWAVRRVARKIKHIFDNIPDESAASSPASAVRRAIRRSSPETGRRQRWAGRGARPSKSLPEICSLSMA